MVVGVYYCMVIWLSNLGWIRCVCVVLSMITILTKEVTQEFPELIISEVVRVGSMGEECPQMFECGRDVSI